MPDPRSRRSHPSPAGRHSQFCCQRSRVGDEINVKVVGELNIKTVPELDRALRRAWASAKVIVLDLRELEFVDSSGAHLIFQADRRIRRSGGRLITVRGGPHIDAFFALIGLNRLLEVVEHPSTRGADFRAVTVVAPDHDRSVPHYVSAP